MRRRRRGERGSAAVELAVILPALCLLVIGGWVLGYTAYAKMALALAANRAARDLAAATELHGRLKQPNQAYRFDAGFAESFGLPRWGLHALAMKTPVVKGKGRKPSDHAVVVAVCYRVPFFVPFGVVAPPEPPRLQLPDTSREEELALEAAEALQLAELKRLVAEYRRVKAEAEAEIAALDGLVDDLETALETGRDVAVKVDWAYRLGKELLSGPASDFAAYRAVKPEQLEAAAGELCAPPDRLKGRSMVLTSRAAYLMQEVYEPKGTGTRRKGGR
ncbi:MAG: TadE family protein [Bacillota bacterium]